MTGSHFERSPSRAGRPEERTWRGKAGRSPAQVTAEQDRAAGGRERRTVALGDGRCARASVELKMLSRQRRIRAYLRWYDRGKSHAVYVGEVAEATRSANLRRAWSMARERGLLSEDVPRSWASSPSARAVMRANKGSDTKPELAVRSAMHALGLRYRVGVRPLPQLRRTADVVFPRERVVVFVDGCFWHGCPSHYRPATTNSQFWSEKIETNRARDHETSELLEAEGWLVVRVWEHEPPREAARHIRDIVQSRRQILNRVLVDSGKHHLADHKDLDAHSFADRATAEPAPVSGTR